MDRRSFLKTSALGGSAAAASTLAAPVYAQGKRTLTMVTSWGRGLAGVFDAAVKTAENITAITDGQITVDVKAAGELVGAFEVFDAVTSGQADMYHAADYYFVNQHPGFAFFTGVPFGMTATELNNWYYHGNGMAMHDKLGEIFGLKSFLAGNTGTQAGGWFRKEVTGPEDFNGLKFRMPGLGGKALGYMGASVQNLPGAEVYQALASGALDGTEWIGPWADEKAGFQEITKFYYTAGFHEPAAGLSVATNREVFEGLTPAQQAAIEVSAGHANVWNLSQYLNNNGAALERLKAGGVKVLEFPDSVWDAFGAASEQVYAEFADDELFAEIFADYRASMAASSGWITDSISAYRTQRDRVLG
ncbi:TRAP transporter substrate-binding protein [Thalassobium sp. R2A62]|jgi:TRAP-type mannitol/chloroaromatic compound transport system substrate-binding protein|uniref:TRAP transporter substrate-binding protein n=1 Tax=Thalassobium sp. R2A62 TaxID=633131 RepID=UPI0001B1CFF0|nr:TRAP transporter substrate-binding protein [Thalassobium sp. R2A62]EET47975.1 bacterial extracellular solute-binding protein, family 7 [Thalassobium sp. R2A62]MDG1340952.1 TRAP transporter substrate-binding protein [Paracoccaceae bacterium]MDG2453698.1 TRAP transporter substrate-binding protein [Paracoccaceae bacterium]